MNNCIDINDTVPIDSLMRFVLPTVSSIPNALGVDLLRERFREFARRTEMLSIYPAIETQTDVTDYEIEAPDGYEIHKIREVNFKGGTVRLPQADYWYTLYGVNFAVVSNNRVVLRDTPRRDGEETFDIIATVIPNECITRIPREISVPYGKAIAAGALADALLYKDKSWYDPGLSRKKELDFELGVNSGKNLQLDNRGAADPRMRGRRWV